MLHLIELGFACCVHKMRISWFLLPVPCVCVYIYTHIHHIQVYVYICIYLWWPFMSCCPPTTQFIVIHTISWHGICHLSSLFFLAFKISKWARWSIYLHLMCFMKQEVGTLMDCTLKNLFTSNGFHEAMVMVAIESFDSIVKRLNLFIIKFGIWCLILSNF